MATARYIPITEVAVMVRTALKKAFPTTKFSVRSKSYSGGCHIDVRWDDGPPPRRVHKVTDYFSGTGFDGMTDSTTHHDRVLNGEPVHFAGSSPSCQRHITDWKAREAASLAMLKERLHLDEHGRFGEYHVDMLAGSMANSGDYRRADWLEDAYRFVILHEEDQEESK
jgi:hypothetical protein